MKVSLSIRTVPHLFRLARPRTDMAPYYEGLCKDLKWQLDGDLLSRMKKANDEELKRLDDVLEDAEKSLGESEIRDAMMAKAEYLIRIGDKVGCCRMCGETRPVKVASAVGVVMSANYLKPESLVLL